MHQGVKSRSVVHHRAPSSHPKKFIRTLLVQTKDEYLGFAVASSYATHTIPAVVEAQVVASSKTSVIVVGVP